MAAIVLLASHGVSGSDTNTFTFSGVSFGTATADRLVIVGVGMTATSLATISSVTIGGVTATSIVEKPHNAGGVYVHSGIFIAAVPTGATGDIVVTWSGTVLRCGFVAWEAHNLTSATPFDSDSSSASPATAGLNVKTDGIAVAYEQAYASAAPGFSWTNLTEDGDEAVEGVGNSHHTAASANTASDETPRTITCTDNGGDTVRALVMASWVPPDAAFMNMSANSVFILP